MTETVQSEFSGAFLRAVFTIFSTRSLISAVIGGTGYTAENNNIGMCTFMYNTTTPHTYNKKKYM